MIPVLYEITFYIFLIFLTNFKTVSIIQENVSTNQITFLQVKPVASTAKLPRVAISCGAALLRVPMAAQSLARRWYQPTLVLNKQQSWLRVANSATGIYTIIDQP